VARPARRDFGRLQDRPALIEADDNGPPAQHQEYLDLGRRDMAMGPGVAVRLHGVEHALHRFGELMVAQQGAAARVDARLRGRQVEQVAVDGPQILRGGIGGRDMVAHQDTGWPIIISRWV
jgi:hypothetical protein